ncbi:hypothetical protein AAHE18_14G092500 [Arachis hypogaea]|uniref:Translocator protein n=1 Tax=Arachis hypogaea TaxID=3818 RepID=A0A444ZG99_ARAHY|nr:hypothetical protein Ahy_B04g070300 isoform A [Arachis hypogaea]
MPSQKSLHETKRTKARRALRSLAIGVLVPLTITLAIIILFGSGRKYHSLTKPFWFPPLWFIHLATLGCSFFMGLATWLVWADGGFRGESRDVMSLYLVQLSLGITWHPIVLVMGAYWLAPFFCVVNFVAIFLCYLRFKRVNPFATDLAKPCLLWSAYLSLISFKLMYL